MSYESKKNADIYNLLSLAGWQINPIDVNFHLKNAWKFLIKIQLPKIWSKKFEG